MSKKRKKQTRLENEAIRDVARLLKAWSARLPEKSDVAHRFARTADRLILTTPSVSESGTED